MLNNLLTTVQTPLKCIGLLAPHKPSVNPVILTKVLALSQYISSTSGLNIAVALPLVHTSISLSKSLG